MVSAADRPSILLRKDGKMHPVYMHNKALGEGGTTDTIVCKYPDSQAVICWTLITAKTSDDHVRNIEIFARQGSRDVCLTHKKTQEKLDSIHVPRDVYLMGDVRLGATFYNIDNNSVIELSAFGYIVE